jgi:hypothetical protein
VKSLAPALPLLLRRYLLPVCGPVFVATSQFILTLFVLKNSLPEQFGQFSLLLVATQLAIALGSALFCAPLASLTAAQSHDRRLLPSLQIANLIFSLAVGVAAAICAQLMHLSLLALVGVGGYAIAAQLRSFGRAQAYAEQAAARPAGSDVIYAISLLPFAPLAYGIPRFSLEIAFLGMMLAAFLGAATLPKRAYILRGESILDRLRVYRLEVWRTHARWSALGVLTTEATANCHVYIVSLVSGPTAFAPLAASAIFVRPLNVLSNALTEFERAQVANALQVPDKRQVDDAMSMFRYIMWAAWLATSIGTVSLLYLHPAAMFQADYDLELISVASALWLLVAAIRNLRMAEGTLLQAGGWFDALANASIKACVISVPAVTCALLLWGPVTSIVGLIIGEAVYAVVIIRGALQLKRSTLPVGEVA